MTYRRIAAALAAALLGSILLATPAQAAPGPVKQTNTGVGSGAGFTATLGKRPTAGNVIVIVVALDGASTVGVLEADDVSNVILMSESWTAWQVEGAPYVLAFGAKADPNVKTWGFHGVAQPVAWLAVELSGIATFASGVPVWDNPALGSAHTVGVGETQLNSGHQADTAVPREVLLASFASRVEDVPTIAAGVSSAGPPPLVTSFGNTYEQPGTWSRLGATVATGNATGPNVRLDVAWKAATVTGSYDCTAFYEAAPWGIAASLTPLRAV